MKCKCIKEKLLNPNILFVQLDVLFDIFPSLFITNLMTIVLNKSLRKDTPIWEIIKYSIPSINFRHSQWLILILGSYSVWLWVMLLHL